MEKNLKHVALELQQLMIDAGLEATLAPYKNCEVGITTGFDVRVELPNDGKGGFLDRFILEDQSLTSVRLSWVLADMKQVVSKDKLELALGVRPLMTAVQLVKQQELRRIAREAYKNMTESSTSDSPQAQA